jgi:flagellar motor component MotA
MKTFFYFLLFLVLAFVVILLAVLLGDQGAWYFAWLIGTAMIVLIAAAGAALLDTQEEHAEALRQAQRPVMQADDRSA